jgi:polyhydroxyalkanoate synthesis regulator protein
MYEAYQERLPERILVNKFMELLNPDDRLSADQEKRLVDSMYEQRKDLYSGLGYDPEELVFPSEMDEGKMAQNMEILDRIYARYTESAGMILKETQMEQFRKYLRQRRDMEESSLEMWRQMSGS